MSPDLPTATPELLTVEAELVRVSVVGAHTQLDVGLPAEVPIASLMGDLVAQMTSRTSEPMPIDRARHWTLAPVGGMPIPVSRSLADAQIRDGDLLVLRSDTSADPPPLFDDVVDAVAGMTERRFRSWSPTAARSVGYAVGIVAAVIAAIALSVDTAHRSLWNPVLAGGAAVAFLVAAAVSVRHHRDPTTPIVLFVAGVPLAFAAGFAAVGAPPEPAQAGLGAAVVLLFTLVSHRLTAAGDAVHAGIATAMLLTVIACTTTALTGVRIGDAAAATAAAGLAVVALAPRLTILLTKLPLPPVPTAADAAVLARTDNVLDAATPIPIDGLPGALSTTSGADTDALERRARTAGSYLGGIICGTTAVVVIAALLSVIRPLYGAASSTPPLAVTTSFAVVIATVLCLRGRAHRDLVQAGALIIGGSVIFLGIVTAAVISGTLAPAAVSAIALALAGGAILIGLVTPNHEFSPPMRRAAELVEFVLAASVIPLLLWIFDLYVTVRQI